MLQTLPFLFEYFNSLFLWSSLTFMDPSRKPPLIFKSSWCWALMVLFLPGGYSTEPVYLIVKELKLMLENACKKRQSWFIPQYCVHSIKPDSKSISLTYDGIGTASYMYDIVSNHEYTMQLTLRLLNIANWLLRRCRSEEIISFFEQQVQENCSLHKDNSWVKKGVALIA